MDKQQPKLNKKCVATHKVFQPIKIGTLTTEEKDYARRFEDKIKRFNDLYAYLCKFIALEDKNVLKANIYETFLTSFLDKEQNNFPPNAPINSILQFMQVDTNKIQSLIDELNAIEFNLEDLNLNSPILPKKDFGIYTTTNEQNDLYFKISKVVNAVNELEAAGKTIYKSPLIQAFNFMLHYDLASQNLSVNVPYILNKIR